MRVVADENMPGLEWLGSDVALLRRPGRALQPADLAGASALLVRSVTRVDAGLLAGSEIGFVGSATIGTDHVDLDWLASQGICFAHAPGCNARAVAEYVLQAALLWAHRQGRPLRECSIGVIGVGHVGTQVMAKMQALGCRVLPCDPPRAQAGDAVAVPWATPGEALDADIVSLHVPLLDAGATPTRHLVSGPVLARLGPEQLLINTCRGAVVDTQALERRLSAPGAPAVVLDVWEREPHVPVTLLQRVLAGTPHIAGYSLQGKLRGSARVIAAFQAWRGAQAEESPVPAEVGIFDGDVCDEAGLLALLQSRYRLLDDHLRLQQLVDKGDLAGFDRLRKEYPVRHELAGVRVRGQVSEAFRPLLTQLGVGW